MACVSIRRVPTIATVQLNGSAKIVMRSVKIVVNIHASTAATASTILNVAGKVSSQSASKWYIA